MEGAVAASLMRHAVVVSAKHGLDEDEPSSASGGGRRGGGGGEQPFMAAINSVTSSLDSATY